MTTPATLLRAATAVLPAATPSLSRSAWAVASDVGLRQARPLGSKQSELSQREIAALLVARLAGDTKPEIEVFAGDLARLRSVSAINGVPPLWQNTASLAAGHSLLDLVEALVADSANGQLDPFRDALSFLWLGFRKSEMIADFRLSMDGNDVLRLDGDEDRSLKALSAIRATYRGTVGTPASGSQQGFGGASGIASSRTMTVGAILALVEASYH